MKKMMVLGEFAQRVGLHKETVIRYQKNGILPERRNPINNWRVFTEEDVKKILKLQEGKLIR